MLHPHAYQSDCQRLLGFTLEHKPWPEWGKRKQHPTTRGKPSPARAPGTSAVAAPVTAMAVAAHLHSPKAAGRTHAKKEEGSGAGQQHASAHDGGNVTHSDGDSAREAEAVADIEIAQARKRSMAALWLQEFGTELEQEHIPSPLFFHWGSWGEGEAPSVPAFPWES